MTDDKSATERWYITTDFLANGGKVYKGLGPFESQELAMQVRSFVEQAEGHNRLFVDSRKVKVDA